MNDATKKLLLDALLACRAIARYTAGLEFSAYERDELIRDAVERRFAIIGEALNRAQAGGKHPVAKPLKGFGGAGVLEVVEQVEGDSYRAVYTVTLPDAVYVLHAFQKKS